MRKITRREAIKLGALSPVGVKLAGLHCSHAYAQDIQSSHIPVQNLVAAKQPTGELTFGVGFNWVDKFPGPAKAEVYPALEDTAGWNAVCEALDDLRPGFLRFWIDTDACADDRGRVNRQARTFDRAKILSDWAEGTDCTLLLDSVHVPRPYQFEQTAGDKSPFLDMAAKDNVTFVREFVVPLLQHVLVDRAMKGFKYYNAYNEPLQYGPFSTPKNVPDPYVHYVEMYREIHNQLKTAGLYPQRILLAGVEAIEPSRFPALEFLARGVDIDSYVDLYTIHYYFHRFDWMTPVPYLPDTVEEAMDRETPPLVKYCRRRGKPLIAAEVGWYPNDNDPEPMPTDPLASSRHHAALTTAETMVRGINAGLTGFGIWSLFNPGTYDGAWQVVSYRDGKIEHSQHLFGMYRLFSRYARPSSRVFPVVAHAREWPWQYTHATALLTPQDKVVVYAINDHLVESRRVHVQLPQAWTNRMLHKIVVDSERAAVPMGQVELKSGDGCAILDDLLFASSLTAYVEAL